uniref:Uncharacterized protein n=1 Tax=viral metagenome TaxID=1070528 RepID=A0A6M3KZY8_9ZZZZ
MNTNGPSYILTSKSIHSIKQNKLSLVADDMAKHGVPHDVTYSVLLARGIGKWLSVRRDLIKLKGIWLSRLKAALMAQYTERGMAWMLHWIGGRRYHEALMGVAYWKGYRRAVEECRKDIRVLCHSPRWQVPDNDNRATKWFDELSYAAWLDDWSHSIKAELRRNRRVDGWNERRAAMVLSPFGHSNP